MNKPPCFICGLRNVGRSWLIPVCVNCIVWMKGVVDMIRQEDG